MEGLVQDDLKILVETTADISLSLFIPTQPSWPEAQQAPIRLEQLLRNAEARLDEHGLRKAAVQELIEPAWQLLTNRPFWQQQGNGLAIFSAPALFRVYRLPIAVAEMAVIDSHFYITPLIPLVDDDRFYVLALSLNQVRLFRCSRYSVDEVALPGVPQGLASALAYDEYEKQSQFHPGVPGRGGERGAVFHGHGSRDDVAKEEILRYFQQIDRGIRVHLRGEQAPLVLAAVEYHLPIYREANTYQYLLDAGVIGNPDHQSAAELHERAWPIVQPIFQRAQQEAIEHYHYLSGAQPKRASAALRVIVPEAYYGRVETLFVAADHQQWGQFDPPTGALTLHDEALPGDAELLNATAIHTLLNSGAVYVLDRAQMPDRAPIAAIFRY